MTYGPTIRVPKANPALGRRAAREQARAIAEADGHQLDELVKAKIWLVRIEHAPFWEYVVEFPDASPQPRGANS